MNQSQILPPKLKSQYNTKFNVSQTLQIQIPFTSAIIR